MGFTWVLQGDGRGAARGRQGGGKGRQGAKSAHPTGRHSTGRRAGRSYLAGAGRTGAERQMAEGTRFRCEGKKQQKIFHVEKTSYLCSRFGRHEGVKRECRESRQQSRCCKPLVRVSNQSHCVAPQQYGKASKPARQSQKTCQTANLTPSRKGSDYDKKKKAFGHNINYLHRILLSCAATRLN